MDSEVIYEKFNWEQLNRSLLNNKIDKIIETIPKDVENIIDIGCGNGVITNALSRKYDVTGVDRSEKALSFVNANKIKASCDNIPLPEKSFDLVFSSELLEHLEDSVFEKTVNELKRLSRKYIYITVPNNENPDKSAVKCPDCGYIYNRANHLRRFSVTDFETLFPEYNIIRSFVYGKRIRYYNPLILKIKHRIAPSSSWIPYYWVPKEERKTICPKCEHEFEYHYRFNPLATAMDILNVVVSPKKPYWLFVVMEKNE